MAAGTAALAMLAGPVATYCFGQAPSAQRQAASLTLTTTKPGAPTGNRFAVDFRDPADPAGKPYAIARIVIELHPGSVIDTSALERCMATDVELLLRGAAACPAASRVGGGVIVSDTGASGGPLPRLNENDVDNFNARDALIAVADARNSPVIPGLTRVVSRSPIRGTRTTIDFPVFPGSPPPDPFTAIRTIRLAGPSIVRNGRAYARTPPTCPRSGHWTNELTFTYRDGVRQRVRTHSPCEASPVPAGTGGSNDSTVDRDGRVPRNAGDDEARKSAAAAGGEDSSDQGSKGETAAAGPADDGPLASTGVTLSALILTSATLVSGGVILEGLARRVS